ncbi:MAG: TAXI family TRAP transporter solute-binding subunit [Alphaproteobacteria bacterium]|nr:TAXI family TRAP transporter solute-binding subunit [Alphaproteobacteria bacterium]
MLHHLGVDVDSGFELMHMDYQESAKALQRGEIVALSTPIRPPAEHMKGILADGRHRLLAFTDADIARADGGLGLWTRYVIPAATYSGQDQDIQTVAKSNLLVARADVDEEVVYQVTKAMFENLSLLRGIHDAVEETALDHALIGVPMLLHPGALRYYKEVGLVAADSDLDVALADQLRVKPAFMASGAIDTDRAQAEARAGDNEAYITVAKAEAPADVEAETFVVYFGLGSKLIDAAGMRVISEAKAFIDQLVAARIEIGGHTDQLGNPSYNAQLAKARAEAVMIALSDIDSHVVAVKTFGERTPAVTLGREIEALNRRVEIKIEPTGQTAKAVAPTETRSSGNATDRKTPSWLLRVTM